MALPPTVSLADDALARVTQLETERDILHKMLAHQQEMAQQLLTAIYAIDHNYFGGHFTAAPSTPLLNPPDPLLVATDIVHAITHELRDSSAFSDSPKIRESIEDILRLFISLRDAVSEQERLAGDLISDVDTTSSADAIATLQFPENHPLASLAMTLSIARELIQKIKNGTRRFENLRLLVSEAERARVAAENSVTPINTQEIAGLVADELCHTQIELNTLSQRFTAENTTHEETVTVLHAELEQAHEVAASATERSQADHAELRGLAAEVGRQVSLTHHQDDDLEINLAVLRQVLSEEHDSACIIAATEAVIIHWVRVTHTLLDKKSSRTSQKLQAALIENPIHQPTDSLAAQHNSTLQAQLTELQERVNAAELTAQQERLRADEYDRERSALRLAIESAELRFRELAEDIERKNSSELDARRAEADSTSRVQRLSGDVAVLRYKITELTKINSALTIRDNQHADVENRLVNEALETKAHLELARTAQSQLALSLEREISERASLRQRLDELEGQSASRITDVTRQLEEWRTRAETAERAKIEQGHHFETLLNAAKDAISKAKELQERTDHEDREIIAKLMNELQELRSQNRDPA